MNYSNLVLNKRHCTQIASILSNTTTLQTQHDFMTIKNKKPRYYFLPFRPKRTSHISGRLCFFIHVR